MSRNLEAEKFIMKKGLCACLPVGGNWGDGDSLGVSISDMVGKYQGPLCSYQCE